jgi:D-serine deaminase-like pyridoxal phosphate-dependent protein
MKKNYDRLAGVKRKGEHKQTNTQAIASLINHEPVLELEDVKKYAICIKSR